MFHNVRRHVLWSMVSYVKPYKKLAILSVIAIIVSSLNLLVLPVSARYMMDFGFIKESQGSEFYYLLFAIVSTLSALSTAWRYYLITWLGERVIADIRCKLFSKILSFDLNQFETIKVGEILSRLTTDTSLVQQIIGVGLSMMMRNTIQLFGAFCMLLVTSFYLTCVFLVAVPLILVPCRAVMMKQRSLSKVGQDKVALTSSYAGETLFAIHVAQAFTHEPYDRQLFSSSVESAFKAQLKRIRMRSVLTIIVTVGITMGFLLVFWVGSHLVNQDPQIITRGQLLQFLAYAVILSSSLVGMADVMGDIQRASGASERLIELLHMKPAIVTKENAVTLTQPLTGAISYEKVNFTYPNRPSRQVINQVSIDIKAGQSVALVGHSGAGKTTMLQLLLRFYDVESGKITIDGMSVDKLPLQTLRGSISFVPQEVVVFSGTIYENILYGYPEATKEQVMKAGELALVDEFAEHLPDGYETLVGERGMRLSGGQRQRLAIARAFLRDAPILLLDEATSNLDAKNERLLQSALKGLMKGRTTLVIAHRLATVMQADQIVFMQHGKVLAQGTHTQLIENCPEYAHLSNLQFIDE